MGHEKGSPQVRPKHGGGKRGRDKKKEMRGKEKMYDAENQCRYFLPINICLPESREIRFSSAMSY